MFKFGTLDELEDLKIMLNETIKGYSEIYGMDGISISLKRETEDKLIRYNNMLKDVLNEINKLK